MQCINQGTALITGSFLLVAVVYFAPFGFQIKAFLNAIGGDRGIFVITVCVTEFIDMVSLCLKFLPFQGGEIRAEIDVVGIVSVCCKCELSGHDVFEFFPHTRTDTEHAEWLPFLPGIFNKRFQHFF